MPEGATEGWLMRDDLTERNGVATQKEGDSGEAAKLAKQG